MKNTFKRILIVLLGLVVLGLLSGFFYRSKPIEYQNKNLGLELNYPRNWHQATAKELTVLNSKRMSDTQIKDAIIHNQNSKIYFSIINQAVGPNQTFDRDGSIKDMDAQLIKQYPSFNKIRAESIDFSGLEAIEYEFEYGTKENKWHDRQIIVRNEDQLFRLIASAPKADYQTSKLDFQKMFESLKFIK